MLDIQRLIAKQRAEVDRLRIELVAAEKVLSMLSGLQQDDGRHDAPNPPAPSGAPIAVAAAKDETGHIFSLEGFEEPGPKRAARLIEGVRSTVKRFGTQEFTAAMTEKAMRALDVPVPGGESSTSKISIMLSELANEGLLTKVYVGAGNVPHRYKLTSSLSEGERIALQQQKSPANIATGQGS